MAPEFCPILCGHPREYGKFKSDVATVEREEEREWNMKGISLIILILAGWFILNRYVLPKLGIDT